MEALTVPFSGLGNCPVSTVTNALVVHLRSIHHQCYNADEELTTAI